jgi:sigma-B regulation protein RsbU (phosphoserine phosphatase)
MAKQEVLIVDDVPANIVVLTEVLKPHYKCRAATSGERALGLATSEHQPDLILLDVMMPDMDGYEVCRRLKADEKTRHIPIIFVTAKTEVEDETLGFDVGGADYVTKPVIPPIVLARVKAHLGLKQAREVISQQNASMLAELETARRVQQALMPDASQDLPGLDVAFTYEPASHVGGDLLDIIPHADGRTVFFIGDAMGHGVQAALVMTVAKSALRSADRYETCPAKILEAMNRDIAGLFEEHFVTAACCVLDAEGVGEIALAGHHSPLLRRAASGEIQQPGESGFPLGVIDGAEYEKAPLTMAEGDALIFSTDGIMEAEDPSGELFGNQRMLDLLQAHGTGKAQAALEAYTSSLTTFMEGREMADDLTLLAIRVRKR